MLSLILVNAQADTVTADGDWDQITVKADGRPVIQGVDVGDFAAAFYPSGADQDFTNAAGGAGRHMEYTHGIYPIDGSLRAYHTPLYPLQPPQIYPLPIGKRVTANSWTYDIVGDATATAANTRFLVSRMFQMGEATAIEQFAACGCNRSQVESIVRTRRDLLKVKTSSKVPLAPSRASDLMGYLPVKLDVPNL